MERVASKAIDEVTAGHLPPTAAPQTSSGLLQLANSANAILPLLGATVANGVIAFTIILAMSFGVIVPKIVIDRLHLSRSSYRNGAVLTTESGIRALTQRHLESKRSL
jgi:hypothetical protein